MMLQRTPEKEGGEDDRGMLMLALVLAPTPTPILPQYLTTRELWQTVGLTQCGPLKHV